MKSTTYTTAPARHIALQLLVVAPAYFDLRRAIRLLTELAYQPPEQTSNQDPKWKHPQ